jgi:hypothetical protein
LINSILNDFDIPKIYLADFTFANTGLNRANKKYAVIDGKQRFEAIFDFFSGDIVLETDFELAEDPSLRLGGLSFIDLTRNYPKIARKFDNFNLTVMSVITDDESKINDLFVRLNSSKPLTGAELRNAMSGSVPALIRHLVTHTFFTKKIRFNTQRSQDKNTAAKLLLIEHRGEFVDTKKSQLDRLVVEAQASESLAQMMEGDEQDVADQAESFQEEEAESRIIDSVEESEGGDIKHSEERVVATLDKMVSVFLDHDPLLASQTSIIPYYWLIRSVEPGRLGQIRPFFVQFEQSIKDNRALKSDDAKRDSELDDYYTMSRTSNDAGSMRGRYRILRGRFDKQFPMSTTHLV